ncbi:hypothetical protein ACQEVB_33245 [Pseudonocardia sp. CA-107938]|uniref:hypothetical protein n=1 Tax=Pseudonocardia sp. CA-107938 TaxID=3240021 RepID=UPI003D8BE1FF
MRSQQSRDLREPCERLAERGRAALVADMAQRDAWLARALAGRTPAEVQLLRIAGELMDDLAREA